MPTFGSCPFGDTLAPRLEDDAFDIRDQLVQKLHTLGVGYYDRHQVGSLVSRVSHDSEALHGLWEGAGLIEVTTGELVVTANYADFDDYWLPFPHGPGPSGAYAASLDEEQRAALGAVLFRRLGSPVGPFTLSARAWFVRGLA